MEPEDAPDATDLSALPAADWPAYFFDRPIVEGWFMDNFDEEGFVRIEDPERALTSLTLLLEGFGAIGRTYSSDQIDQGIWAMWGPDYELHGLFWDAELSWPLRERAIRAMFIPYCDYVAGHPAEVMENGLLMWWELVGAYPWFEGPEEDKARVRGVYLETLKLILALDDTRCRKAALHGLGHLDHPDRPAVVQAFMDAQPSQERGLYGLGWLEACRDGTVM